MSKFLSGQSVTRREDQRFITGKGRYTDDIVLPQQTWLHFFRSPYAHARIVELDVSGAQEMPGVLAVYTGPDLLAAGVRDVPGAGMPDGSRAPLKQPPLARDVVRYVGEPVAAVVAESAAAARDAAEAIFMDVEDLPAVVSPRAALQPDAMAIHATLDNNCFGTLFYGDRAATDAKFATAALTVAIDVINNRVAPTAMEPRGCNASFDSASGIMTVYQGCQGVHPLRDRILKCVDLDKDKLRVVSPDVGGGFGLKFFLQCETVVVVHASRALGRAVKWTADRSESFMSDIHGRDHVSRAELAIARDGRFLAMRAAVDANIGAYCSQAGPIIPWFGACMTTGCYDIPTAHVAVRSVLTNTAPVDAYRGAGRPEAAYLIERLVDKAAIELGVSRDELRRMNFIKPQQFPYTTPTGRSYDSGDYTTVMNSALERAGWSDFEARREQSKKLGKLRGIGLAYYVEICSAMGAEETHVSVTEKGRVQAVVGTQSTGQGHETSYAQIVAASLGIDHTLVDVNQGDTHTVPTGQGTNGSRSMAIAGSALVQAAEELITAGKQMASTLLSVDDSHIEFAAGCFHNKGSGNNLSLFDVAAASFDTLKRPTGIKPGLQSSARFEPDGGTYPNGCHVCEVEVDPATGVIDILRYTIEDDVGVVINPLLLEGQIVGGVAQGLGQALSEHAVYDEEDGQLLTATFMDYGMPRADWMPQVDFRYREIASPRNPLGVKGAGEAGTVGAAPALVNAVLDALRGTGITHLDMPLTPLKMWQAIRGSRVAAPN
ncbi:MAG: xanthine dehydrogenase family protein molybdopterin-binding subunit [Woeseia sp.]|nr:xanthine dehydrogenase family protein molybdopterin-binding subunit [Woeseia sp.]NNE61195.1 xanthine dehydrogenase family protein molybdopterin-binding subunit [Woeseia sp.]NNL55742.1 xanthine dehydrogenase family protein molybdopterin-binding subunit [Woeseia sp.]